MMMLFGLSIGFPGLLRGVIHPAILLDKKVKEVAGRLRRLVFSAPTSAEPPVPEVALRELLRGRGVYEVGPSGVDLAPYRSNLLSPEVRVFFGWRTGAFAKNDG